MTIKTKSESNKKPPPRELTAADCKRVQGGGTTGGAGAGKVKFNEF